MKLLESRVRAEGHALDERVLLVDSFLNHQVDPELMLEIGKEFARLFAEEASPAWSRWKAPALRPPL